MNYKANFFSSFYFGATIFCLALDTISNFIYNIEKDFFTKKFIITLTFNNQEIVNRVTDRQFVKKIMRTRNTFIFN